MFDDGSERENFFAGFDHVGMEVWKLGGLARARYISSPDVIALTRPIQAGQTAWSCKSCHEAATGSRCRALTHWGEIQCDHVTAQALFTLEYFELSFGPAFTFLELWYEAAVSPIILDGRS